MKEKKKHWVRFVNLTFFPILSKSLRIKNIFICSSICKWTNALSFYQATKSTFTFLYLLYWKKRAHTHEHIYGKIRFKQPIQDISCDTFSQIRVKILNRKLDCLSVIQFVVYSLSSSAFIFSDHWQSECL